MRDVGEMGENTLKLWASQLGISANKASQDKTGWDFLLEFPLAHAIEGGLSIALDKGSFPLACSLQVKSTDKRPGKWQVKMDNWLRFVKSPLPTFFLVLEFNTRKVCQRAFLVHVDENYIRRVLKRLRETETTKAKEIHKMTLQFTYGENDALSSLDGNGLEQAIRHHVGGSLEDYAKRKIELVETVGYEDGYRIAEVSVLIPSDRSDDIQDYLTDFSLGIVPHLQIKQGHIRDVRFGISAQEPSMIFQEGSIIEFDTRPTGRAILRLRTPDTRRELRLDTDVYASEGFTSANVDPRYRKLRLTTKFVNMMVYPYGGRNGDLDFILPDPSERYNLKSLQTTAGLILFLHEASQNYSHVDFFININSLSIGSGQLSLKKISTDDLITYADVVDKAWKIVKYFDVQAQIELKPAELLRQKDQLTLMLLSTGSLPGEMRVIFSSDADLPDESKDCCIPIVTYVVIGQYQMIVAAALFGNLKLTGQITEDRLQFELPITRVKVCRQYLYDRGERIELSSEELIDAVTEEYQDTHHVLVLRD